MAKPDHRARLLAVRLGQTQAAKSEPRERRQHTLDVGRTGTEPDVQIARVARLPVYGQGVASDDQVLNRV